MVALNGNVMVTWDGYQIMGKQPLIWDPVQAGVHVVSKAISFRFQGLGTLPMRRKGVDQQKNGQ